MIQICYIASKEADIRLKLNSVADLVLDPRLPATHLVLFNVPFGLERWLSH